VSDPVVLSATADGIATITLNRPHRLNAWTGRMHAAYRSAMADAEHDPAVRVVIVTGAGRGFCAGADVAALEKEAAAGHYDDGLREEPARPGWGVRPDFDHPFAFHLGLTKPVIAMVNGPAAGVGLVLACFADVRFAATGAKLTTAHGRLGLPAEFGLSWLLPRLIGAGRAADLLLSSRVVSGEEAESMGLVSRAVPVDRLRATTLAYAADLATTVSPTSLWLTKRQLYADLHGDLGTAMSRSAELLDAAMGGPDFAAGVRALRDTTDPECA
jgi:enoyl-CoA hydratase/carnithine racemase